MGAPQFCRQGGAGAGHGKGFRGWSTHSPWNTVLHVRGPLAPGERDLGESRWHLGKRGGEFTESRAGSCVLGRALCPRGREGSPLSGEPAARPWLSLEPADPPGFPGTDVLTRQSGHSCLAPRGPGGGHGRRWRARCQARWPLCRTPPPRLAGGHRTPRPLANERVLLFILWPDRGARAGRRPDRQLPLPLRPGRHLQQQAGPESDGQGLPPSLRPGFHSS